MADININGLFEYKYLDSNNELKTEEIGIINNFLYKNILSTPKKIQASYDTWQFSDSKCSFAIYQDKLYIANGKDYIYIYDGNKGILTQQGAPFVKASSYGYLTGLFAYAITYITAGGEEVLGSISNIVNAVNNKIVLDLPLGYDGVISRKIYRAYNGDYSNLILIANISDNTTLQYIDNIPYGSEIGTPIPTINNELPKPYFIKVFNGRLIGCKCDKTPTQLYITEAGLDIFDSANFLDITNFGDDNTEITGLGVDFSYVVVFSEKNVFLLTIGTTNSLTITRVNVGCKDGFSIVKLPSFADFPGGIMFVSSNNDIRILNGLDALPVSTSVNNIRSDNWAQNIRGTLENDLKGSPNIYSIYYNYKYHLIVNGNKYIFDIRTNGWTYHNIETENYKSNPYVLGILNNELYNGQVAFDSSISDDNIVLIEKEYSDITYRGEEVPAFLESSQINVSDKYSFVEKLIIWYLPTEENKMKITVITDDDIEYQEEADFELVDGVFENDYFTQTDFNIAKNMDYKVFNIYKNIRWLKFKIENNIGNCSIQGWGIYSQPLSNKEQ